MIDGKKVLAVIPARGGSKGLPRKNILEVGGKPLIAWTIDAGRQSKYIDRLILSSEDPEIIEVARRHGCDVPFVRPVELALDTTPGIEVILHAATALPGYDFIVLLQPTSPLRTVEDIDGCIEQCVRNHAGSCVTVAEAESSPYWMFFLGANKQLNPVMGDLKSANTRRQDLPLAYSLNGAVYVNATSWLFERRAFVGEDTIGYVMPRSRSLDIDTKMDLVVFREMIGEVNGAH